MNFVDSQEIIEIEPKYLVMKESISHLQTEEWVAMQEEREIVTRVFDIFTITDIYLEQTIFTNKTQILVFPYSPPAVCSLSLQLLLSVQV